MVNKYVLGAIGILMGAYTTGTHLESKRLSRELEPLRVELSEIAKTAPEITRTMDVGAGRERIFYQRDGVDELNEFVAQFAKDNGAKYRSWAVDKTGENTSSRGPIAWNPRKWGSDVDASAIDAYLNK
ncbi:MAG: hypothetical protein ACLFN8_04470 [Candidatus Woesearchaeota archaeon]